MLEILSWKWSMNKIPHPYEASWRLHILESITFYEIYISMNFIPIILYDKTDLSSKQPNRFNALE